MTDSQFLWTIAGVVLGWIALVNLFAAVMHAKAIIDRGERIHWSFRYPLYAGALLGLLLDIAFNWTGGVVFFREAPREFTFSSRVQRHVYDSHGWQQQLAVHWAIRLNQFDPGHIQGV